MRLRVRRTTLLLATLVIVTVYIKISRMNVGSDAEKDSVARSVAAASGSEGGPEVVPAVVAAADTPAAKDPNDPYSVDIGGVKLADLEAKFKVSPFEDGKPHKLLIVSYRASEGTLVGELIDNTPNSMHMTEPLDGAYTAMYGSRDFLCPEDVMNNKDGTLRILPDDERDAVANVIGDILDCKIEGIPTDTLVHPYWFRKMGSQMSNLPLIECLKVSSLVFHRQCRPIMMKDCPGRFDPSLPKTPQCKKILWDTMGGSRGGEYVGEPDASVTPTVKNYTDCMKDARQKIDRCENIMHTYCSKTNLRAVTTVRTSMDVAKVMMEKDPNFRVVHMVRNPQAISAIRQGYDNASQSYFGLGDPVKEAIMYCQMVKHNREVMADMEEKFPGRTLEVGYEEFIQNPMAWTEFFFKFMGAPVDVDAREYIRPRAPLFQTEMNDWYTLIPYNTARYIRDMCNIMWYGKAYDF